MICEQCHKLDNFVSYNKIRKGYFCADCCPKAKEFVQIDLETYMRAKKNSEIIQKTSERSVK